MLLKGITTTLTETELKVQRLDGEIENEIRSIEADLNYLKLALANKRARDDENRV